MPATKTIAAKSTRLSAKSDPDAAAVASAAKELAREAGLTSAYTVGEGREVLNHFNVTKSRGALHISRDGGEPVKVKATKVAAFIAGDKDADTAAAFAALAKDLKGMLYGRKLACFITAAAARR